MMKSYTSAAALFLLAGLFSQAGAQEIRFRDPSFESFRKVQKNPYWWQLLNAKSGTALSDSKIKHSRSRSLKVTVKDEFLYVRHLGGPHKTQPGTRYTFSVWARGKGILNLVIKQHAEKIGYVGSYHAPRITPLCSEDFALTDQWKKYSFEFRGDHPGLIYMDPQIALSGKGSAAWLDTAEIITHPADEKRISFIPECLVLKKGMTANFSFPKNTLNGKITIVLGRELTKCSGRKKHTLSAGESFTLKLPEKEGCYAFAVLDDKGSAGRRCYIHVLPDKQYDHLLKLSSEISNPGKVLVLGDSLSDYLRGYNWIGILEDLCRKRFGDKTRFYNYAVGGDHAPRVLNRLLEVKNTYALDRYKGIKEVDPDLILISLGHNDSLSLDRALKDKSPTQVPEMKYADTLKKIVALLRKRHPRAKVVLFTPYSMCYAKTLKHYFHNRKLVYGEPVIMKRYADRVKKVAQEIRCGVLDVYTPSSKVSDQASYYMDDGIHMNIKGNLFATEQVLKYLKKK